MKNTFNSSSSSPSSPFPSSPSSPSPPCSFLFFWHCFCINTPNVDRGVSFAVNVYLSPFRYGGNRSAFVDNRCVGTGERGMIYFAAGFNGNFAKNASSNVVNNTQDDPKKPICGGMHFPNKVLDAPGCVTPAPHVVN